jgi:FkbM family methyltransferase
MNFYAQYGEDRVLWQLYKGKKDGVCVEVGGFDGETFSNTLTFEEQGWRAIIVEPMGKYADKIRERRPKASVFSCAAGAVAGETVLIMAHGAETLSTTTSDPLHLSRIKKIGGKTEELKVEVRPLDEMLEEAHVNHINFITIDVEGGEIEVLKGFDFSRWLPEICILEIGDTQKRSELHALLAVEGYRYILTTGDNDWFASREGYKMLPLNLRIRCIVRKYPVLDFLISENLGLKYIERTVRKKVKGWLRST